MGVKRPHRTGQVDAIGRPVSVADTAARRPTAPPPSCVDAPVPCGPFTVDRVVDTRTYDLDENDRWVPIDAGDSRECDRCGRLHSIHAHVTDSNGNSWVVGVGCADVGDQAAVRKLSNQAAAAARADIAGRDREGHAARVAELVDAAAGARFDETVVARRWDPARLGGRGGRVWECDGVAVYSMHRESDVVTAAEDAERVRCLEGAWRRATLVAAAGGPEEWSRLHRRAGRPPIPWL